jgi:hypothetical protein
MLTIAEFDAINVGDQVSVAEIFGALSDEKIIMTTRQKDEDKAEFVATYFGVTLGRWVATKVGDDIVWSF